MDTVPVIDVRALVDATSSLAARREVAARMGVACRHNGFFYVTGHGVDVGLQARLESLAREFFARSEAEKQSVRMALGGRAWRGFFPVGGELTSGRPDRKEGLYFGTELSPEDPRVLAGTPLHGPNLFPREPAGLGGAVLEYMEALTSLGHALMSGIALSLELEEDFFAARYMKDPTVLFRIFNYPPGPEVDGEGLPVWGVGEHTDYGVLTILKQDDAGGLQVKSRKDGQVRWMDAPPVEGTFVCNIGDMLDRMTRGVYRSTPHRVLNRAGRDRLSLPFFFDPGWTAEIHAIDSPVLRDGGADDHAERWDRQSVHAFRGTYGDYLLGKVGKVFPDLRAEVL
ncbi:isopenicillin N synthase family oxygenase [Corallococcus praedator]|uniref:2-oxoglutarate-dependent ethylene/succinate-forming enzyme n=1 Tax=Corallococcus praedator TaxID=2316724 RepID=A0ABX9QQ02_9BACT|nr:MULTISPECIES: 2-oxoglutarate and iron-dependent oxygenase domain-containing protein [Corallococcus]RKH20734.1 isopenicillin N synthase family oxygenase [Corallococcus sp. CA047B]RKH33782.1 isopenicillin N synthase family oxygenase [Corallococcus sp. CA031C]RKI16209.1 isopenicillin N synthase family oxygenase [Corallococcus praedator]